MGFDLLSQTNPSQKVPLVSKVYQESSFSTLSCAVFQIGAYLHLCLFLLNRFKGLLKDLLLDSVITVEALSVSLEMGVLLEHYGITVWLVALYLNALYQGVRWHGLCPPLIS